MNVDDLMLALQVVPNPSATEVRNHPAVISAAGDFTGGAAEDLFTAAAHGLTDEDRIRLVYESAAGVVTGAVGDIFYANVLSSSTFQLSLTSGGAIVENTADGTAVFIREAVSGASIAAAEEEGIDSADAGYVVIS